MGRDEAYPAVENLLILSSKLDISLDELFADELKYYSKVENEEAVESVYPGMVAGLKTLAHILRPNK